jgi:hypothetical protein
VETAAGTAKCKVPRISGMVMPKVRARVLSSGGIKRSAFVGCWRRSNRNSNPSACHAIPSSRQMICTTLSRICSSISVTSRGSSVPLPSPPNKRSIKGNAMERSSCSSAGTSMGASLHEHM